MCWRAGKGPVPSAEHQPGHIWKELSQELFVCHFHTEEGLGFDTICLAQNKTQIGKEIYYTQISQDYKCPMEGNLPERVFSSWLCARTEQPCQNYLGAWKMEQILGWIKQWHQQMPGLRKEGKAEMRALAQGPPRR